MKLTYFLEGIDARCASVVISHPNQSKAVSASGSDFNSGL